MLTLHIPEDPADVAGLPLHERVTAALRRALAAGEVAVGALLPPARELAAALDVHPNTVLRAYRTLRDEGLIDLRAGRGARVLPGADAPAGLTGPIDELLRSAARAGVALDDLLALVRARADRRRTRGGTPRPTRPRATPAPTVTEETS